MKILYVTPYYKPAWFYGGPPKCIAEQAEFLNRNFDLDIEVLTLNINGSKTLFNTSSPVIKNMDGIKVHYLPISTNSLGKAYFESNYLYDYINNFLKADLIHIHTLFNAFSRKGMQFAYQHHIPYIVTPHGMLDSFSLSRSRWAKKIHRLLFDDKLLSAAKAVQFTTTNELNSSVITRPVQPVIIPLGFEFPDVEPAKNGKSDDMLRMVFLGRINRKKGIDLLIKAFTKLNKKILPDIYLDIYGAEDDNSKKDLEQLVAAYHLKKPGKILRGARSAYSRGKT